MSTVHVALAERSYDILIGHEVLDGLGAACSAVGLTGTALVITDTMVGPLYGARIHDGLTAAGYRVLTAEMPAGEAHKNWETMGALYDQALAGGLDRRAFVVALGGGVVGDVAGFVAATLLRGLRCVQVPTTLLAQVDSSVGGKTGIDHPTGKNLIGAFHQPSLVYIDTAALRTLDPRQTRAGMAEVVKYGFIQDAEFLAWIEAHVEALLNLDAAALAHAVARSCELKAQVVAQDERETSGLRAIFNFGHTTGHTVEALSGYSDVLHGEGVAMGMVVEAEVARLLGRVDAAYVERVRDICRRLGLPVQPPPLDHAALVEAMRRDKKNVGGSIAMTLPTAVGCVSLHSNVPANVVMDALRGISETKE